MPKQLDLFQTKQKEKPNPPEYDEIIDKQCVEFYNWAYARHLVRKLKKTKQENREWLIDIEKLLNKSHYLSSENLEKIKKKIAENENNNY